MRAGLPGLGGKGFETPVLAGMAADVGGLFLAN